MPVVIMEERNVEEKKLNLLAEVHLRGGPRYRVQARGFVYAYLGDKVSPRSSDNFLTLVRDLLRLAPATTRNRGAALLAADPPRTLAYPSRHAFEEELVWCLWMKGQGA